MPVIGHALAGVATAAATRSVRPPVLAPSAWTATMVAFAYLPDAVGHALLMSGWMHGAVWSHAVVVAVPTAAVAGWIASWMLHIPGPTAVSLAVLSVLIHIALDLLGGTPRSPWWPLFAQPIQSRWILLPDHAITELLVCAVGSLLLLTAWRMRRASSAPVAPHSDIPVAPRHRLSGGIAIIVILAAAAVVHLARGRRQAQWTSALAHFSAGDMDAAIRAAGDAARWPSAASPGSAEYIMAEALVRSGDRIRAEAMYLESCRLAPDKFWPVADLALFHASGPESNDVRRRRTAPWRACLLDRFARHPDLQRMLDKIDRSLIDDAGAPARDRTDPLNQG